MTLKVKVNDHHWCKFGDSNSNLLSCGEGKVYRRVDRQTQETTIPLRPERPRGKNQSSTILAFCKGKSPVTGGSPHKGPVKWKAFPCLNAMHYITYTRHPKHDAHGLFLRFAAVRQGPLLLKSFEVTSLTLRQFDCLSVGEVAPRKMGKLIARIPF